MNHTITIGNRKFFTAQVVDEYDHKTYDMTVIFEDMPNDPPRLVNYYFGEPQISMTARYLQWHIDGGI